jgi:hypothetical protein
MIRATDYRGAIVALIIFCKSLSPASSQVVVELSTAKRVYTIGDEIRMNLRYTNRGRETITLLPELAPHPAEWFAFVKIGGGPTARLFNDFEAPWVDFEQLSKRCVVLRPGRSVVRTICARLASSLPTYFQRRQRGLFLIFPGTAALELPGPGGYAVTATYRSPRDNPVKQYLPKRLPLWEGTATSNSVRLKVRSHNESGRMQRAGQWE